MLIYDQNRNSIFEVNFVGIYDTKNTHGEVQIIATASSGVKGEIATYPTRELAQMELNSMAEALNAGTVVYYMTKAEEK